jgi:hypothetical protein
VRIAAIQHPAVLPALPNGSGVEEDRHGPAA